MQTKCECQRNICCGLTQKTWTLSSAHTGTSHLHFSGKEVQVHCQFNLKLRNCHFFFRNNIPDKNTVVRPVDQWKRNVKFEETHKTSDKEEIL